MHDLPADDSYDRDEPMPDRKGQPTPWLAWFVLGINVVVYLAMGLSLGNFVSFLPADLIEWGGSFAPRIAQGEYWRALTAMFLHAGIVHIAMNMWVLSMIGPTIERIFGSTSFLLIYLASGLAGSIFGLAWNADVVSVGASGAIFGLFGAFMGFLFMRRHVLPPEVLRPLMQNGLYFLVVNLILGFTVPGIDVAAHLFGALAGLIAGIAATWQPLASPTSAWTLRNGLLAVLLVAIAGSLPVVLPNTARAHGQFTSALKDLQTQEQVFAERYQAIMASDAAPEQKAAELEREVLAPWRAMGERFPPFEQLPARQQSRNDVRQVYEYLSLMQSSVETRIRLLRDGDQQLHPIQRAQLQDAERLWQSKPEEP